MSYHVSSTKMFVLLVLINLGLICLYIPQFQLQTKDPVTLPMNPMNPIPLKKILFWNIYFYEPYYFFGKGRGPFINSNCSENRCFASNRFVEHIRNFEEYDAIVFHGWYFSKITDLYFLKSRNVRQRYVFLLKESPQADGVKFGNLRNVPPGFFNWTMTYRLDSDILNVYGAFKTLTKPNQYLIPPTLKWMKIPNDFKYDNLPERTKSIIARKNKMVAWFVSHCNTPGERESYVKELQKYIRVDVYGACGENVCKMSSGNDECYRLLENNYKFYLSFENSICRDYITEKLFAVMKYNIVPIVYGGGNYSVRAPPRSYIDVKDYDSPRHLAEHLLHLASHPEEYAKHYWWRSYYEPVGVQDSGFCRLCEMLHDETLPAKSYDNIWDWFGHPGICQSREDYLQGGNFNKHILN